MTPQGDLDLACTNIEPADKAAPADLLFSLQVFVSDVGAANHAVSHLSPCCTAAEQAPATW